MCNSVYCMYVRVRACIYVCACVCMYTCVCAHAHVRMSACVQVGGCVRECMHNGERGREREEGGSLCVSECACVH